MFQIVEWSIVPLWVSILEHVAEYYIRRHARNVAYKIRSRKVKAHLHWIYACLAASVDSTRFRLARIAKWCLDLQAVIGFWIPGNAGKTSLNKLGFGIIRRYSTSLHLCESRSYLLCWDSASENSNALRSNTKFSDIFAAYSPGLDTWRCQPLGRNSIAAGANIFPPPHPSPSADSQAAQS